MSLREEVMIILQRTAEPLTTRQIARMMGRPCQSITSPVSRLHMYGFIKPIGRTRANECLWRIKEAAYR